MLSFFSALFLAISIYSGCGGNSDGVLPLSYSAGSQNIVTAEEEPLVIDNDDAYYAALEKKLNDELDINRAPDKCAAQGLSKIVLSSTTDEISTCSTYNLSNISATAYFSNKTAEVVTPIWSIYSGGGTLDGDVYTASIKPAIIVFKALYSDNGISKTAQFRLKVIGLSSLTLSITTDEVKSCQNYDMSRIRILNKMSDGTVNDVTNNGAYILLTYGKGEYSQGLKLYTTPALAETAAFTAYYFEGGIYKTSQFRLKVTALSSLVLSKTTDEIQTGAHYDLASNLSVTAKFSDGQTKEVTRDPNLKWTLSYGSGTLDGSIYASPDRIETATITVTYTEFGVTQSTQFKLKTVAPVQGAKVQLLSVTLNKSTDTVRLGQTYDLSKLIPIGKFSDKTTREVSLSWIVTSGGGTINGNTYNAPDNAANVKLMGTCIAADGSTKSAYLTLSVFGVELYGNQAIVTSAGAKFNLRNGCSFEIPPESVDSDGRVTINEVTDLPFRQPNMKVLDVDSTNKIQRAILRVPVKPGTKNSDIVLTCIYDEINDLIYPQGTIDDSVCVYLLGNWPEGQASPVNRLLAPSRAIETLNNGKVKLIFKEDDPNVLIECSKVVNNVQFEGSGENRKGSKIIKWPYYKQLSGNCWAACWLMLLKGYKPDLSGTGFDAIYRIFKKTGKQDNEGISHIEEVKWFTAGPNNRKPYFPSGIDIPSSTSDILETKVTGCLSPTTLDYIRRIIISIQNNNPVLVNLFEHTFIITGYEFFGENITYDSLKNFDDIRFRLVFIAHDPRMDESPYKKISARSLVAYNVGFTNDFSLYHLTLPTSESSSKCLHTIHLPHAGFGFGVKLCYGINGGTEITRTNWATSSDTGYTWTNYGFNEIPAFNYIKLGQIPVSNTSGGNIKAKMTVTVFKGAMENTDEQTANVRYHKSLSNAELVDFKSNGPSALPITPSFDFKIEDSNNNQVNLDDFLKKDDGTEFLMQIALVKRNDNDALDVPFETDQPNILDKFTVKFNHKKAILVKTPIDKDYKFTCMLGDDDITNYMEWTCEYFNDQGDWISVDNLFENNLLTPMNAGKYIIKAKTRTDITVPENIKNRKVEFEGMLNGRYDGSMNIIPQKEKIGVFEETLLYAKCDDNYVDPIWSIFNNDANNICGIIETFPFDGVVYTAPKFNAAPARSSQSDSPNKALYTAPGTPNTYYVKAFYWGVEDSCAIEVMPTTITNDIKSSMYKDESVPFTVKINGVTESKEILLTSDGGEISTVSIEFSKDDYCVTLNSLFKLNSGDSLSKYKITTSLADFPDIDKVEKEITVLVPISLTVTQPSKIDFIGNPIQYTAKYGDTNVTPGTTWQVLNPDVNVITNQQGIFEDGLLLTSGEISAVKEYNILASYTDPNSHATSTQEVKIKLLPGIIPSKKTFISTAAQSVQLKLGVDIIGNPAEFIIWSGNNVDSNGVYSFPAHYNDINEISVTLTKGAMLASGETLETALTTKAIMKVLNIYVESSVNLTDCGKPCRFDLKWEYYTYTKTGNFHYLHNITNAADWQSDDGDFTTINNVLYFIPRKPGVCVVTAKLADGATFINDNGVISGNDVETTAEVTVVEIKVLDQPPLIARIEPVDAENEPMANYRAECEFKVSVDGATVPIELPDVAASSGKIELLSVTDGNVLPVIHTFKFTPPPPMTATPYYFDNDETLHVNIKSSAFEQPSTSTEIVVYKPLQKTVATFYPSGKKQQLYQILSYTDSGNILYNGNEYYHGSANGWWDDALNTYQGGGPYDRNEAIGIHPHYQENGLMHEWYNFVTFTHATHTIYEYTYSYGTQITKTYFYTLTRQSIHEGWTHTYNSTYTSSGWTPPPHTLPPAGQ